MKTINSQLHLWYIFCCIINIPSFSSEISYFYVSLNLVSVPNVRSLTKFVAQLLYNPSPSF